MQPSEKSSVEEIRRRFDAEVERFANLETGQSATMDAPLCLELIGEAAPAVTQPISRVLDLGCGAGNFSLRLQEKAPEARYTLVDLSPKMLARAKERLGGAVAATHAEDLRNLNFPNGGFDVILAGAVLHHLRTPEEWERVFRRFLDWLRPGGAMWIFDLVSHENAGVQRLMWKRYGVYLENLGGAAFRDKVFAYVEHEDTPTSLDFQLALARRVGFAATEVLHKHGPFAAFGLLKGANSISAQADL